MNSIFDTDKQSDTPTEKPASDTLVSKSTQQVYEQNTSYDSLHDRKDTLQDTLTKLKDTTALDTNTIKK